MNIVVQYMEDNRKQLLSAISGWIKESSYKEDIYQDAVLEVIKANPDVGEDKALAYAWVVCRRKAMHHNIEQGKRHEGCPEDSVDLTFVQLHGEKTEECRDPQDRLIDLEKHISLPENLGEIRNSQHKELMELVLLDEVSIGTAAMIVGLSVNNARVIVHRLSSLLKI
jgi:DNA-directed RNA polymerase specialized sigma24 family protein